MLIHLGPKRTPHHNIKLATLLGLTGGFVNAAGFLAFSVLTTNVTGHAALVAERMAVQDFDSAQVVALWMLLFLAGAFIASLIISFIGPNQRFSYLFPILIEISILLFCALYGNKYDASLVSKKIFAGSLLFSMGMQNSLVSMISGSVVRTTHLTGTFTDLGIELAHLVNRKNKNLKAVKAKIKLRLFIIVFFMIGALSGAYCFNELKFIAFLIPVAILIYALLYDLFRLKVIRYYRTASAAVRKSMRDSF